MHCNISLERLIKHKLQAETKPCPAQKHIQSRQENKEAEGEL